MQRLEYPKRKWKVALAGGSMRLEAHGAMGEAIDDELCYIKAWRDFLVSQMRGSRPKNLDIDPRKAEENLRAILVSVKHVFGAAVAAPAATWAPGVPPALKAQIKAASRSALPEQRMRRLEEAVERSERSVARWRDLLAQKDEALAACGASASELVAVTPMERLRAVARGVEQLKSAVVAVVDAHVEEESLTKRP